MDTDLEQLKHLSSIILSSVSGPQATADAFQAYYEKAESIVTYICEYYNIPVDSTYPGKGLKTPKGKSGRDLHTYHEATIQTLSMTSHPLHQILGQGEVYTFLHQAKTFRNKWSHRKDDKVSDETVLNTMLSKEVLGTKTTELQDALEIALVCLQKEAGRRQSGEALWEAVRAKELELDIREQKLLLQERKLQEHEEEYQTAISRCASQEEAITQMELKIKKSEEMVTNKISYTEELDEERTKQQAKISALEAAAKEAAEVARTQQAEIVELEAAAKASSEAASTLALNITGWTQIFDSYRKADRPEAKEQWLHYLRQSLQVKNSPLIGLLKAMDHLRRDYEAMEEANKRAEGGRRKRKIYSDILARKLKNREDQDQKVRGKLLEMGNFSPGVNNFAFQGWSEPRLQDFKEERRRLRERIWGLGKMVSVLNTQIYQACEAVGGHPLYKVPILYDYGAVFRE